MARILVVEDDPSVRSFMEKYLARNGFEVTAAETGEAAYEVISKEEMDLIILDLMLPGDDGLEITRKIRRTSDVPIIMVTARSDVVDRVVGLEVGADDYLPKPFEARELLARVRSVLRRTTGPEAPAEAPPPQETPANKTARFADWIVDPTRRDVRKEDGEILHLSTAEFDLLTTLISSPEKPLSRNALLEKFRDNLSYSAAPPEEDRVAEILAALEELPLAVDAGAVLSRL